MTLICVVLLHFTSYGRGIYAIGNNPRASFISGVPTTAIQIATYALCSFFAAITGLLILGRTGYSSKTAGDPYMLMSIAAVVIGGTSIIGGRGKIIGTIGGALVMTILHQSADRREHRRIGAHDDPGRIDFGAADRLCGDRGLGLVDH